jgi:uncharacterized membrane protein YebE (DUF533 family)
VTVDEPGLLAKLRTAVGRPTGEASALSTADQGEPDPGGAADRAEDGEPEFDPGIVGVLAQKVLNAWLRNRHQLLFPFTVDLRRLDVRETELVIHAMIAAALADGSMDGKERTRMEAALDLTGGSGASILDDVLQHPRSLNEIVAEAQDAKTAALIYAATLLVVDRSRPVNRYYLKYLAARLQLPDELVGSLRQRYRPAS